MVTQINKKIGTEMPLSLNEDKQARKIISETVKNTKSSAIKKVKAKSIKQTKAKIVKVTRSDDLVIQSEAIIEENKQMTIDHMKNLGFYHDSYTDLINIYATMLFEYDLCMAQFKEDGRRYEVDTGTGSTKKSGLVSAMETLRKDIGTYSDRLNLNPKATGGVADEKPQSKMEQFLKDFN